MPDGEGIKPRLAYGLLRVAVHRATGLSALVRVHGDPRAKPTLARLKAPARLGEVTASISEPVGPGRALSACVPAPPASEWS